MLRDADKLATAGNRLVTLSTILTGIRTHNNESFYHFTTTLAATKDTDYSLRKVARATHKPTGYTPHYVDQITVGQEVIHERAEICAERLEQRFKPKDMTTNVTPDIILTEEDGANLFSPKEIKNMISKELNPKNPVQIPEIETCFMFIDEIEGEIPCPRAHNIYRRRSSEFF